MGANTHREAIRDYAFMNKLTLFSIALVAAASALTQSDVVPEQEFSEISPPVASNADMLVDVQSQKCTGSTCPKVYSKGIPSFVFGKDKGTGRACTWINGMCDVADCSGYKCRSKNQRQVEGHGNCMGGWTQYCAAGNKWSGWMHTWCARNCCLSLQREFKARYVKDSTAVKQQFEADRKAWKCRNAQNPSAWCKSTVSVLNQKSKTSATGVLVAANRTAPSTHPWVATHQSGIRKLLAKVQPLKRVASVRKPAAYVAMTMTRLFTDTECEFLQTRSNNEHFVFLVRQGFVSRMLLKMIQHNPCWHS